MRYRPGLHCIALDTACLAHTALSNPAEFLEDSQQGCSKDKAECGDEPEGAPLGCIVDLALGLERQVDVHAKDAGYEGQGQENGRRQRNDLHDVVGPVCNHRHLHAKLGKIGGLRLSDDVSGLVHILQHGLHMIQNVPQVDSNGGVKNVDGQLVPDRQSSEHLPLRHQHVLKLIQSPPYALSASQKLHLVVKPQVYHEVVEV
mmetsp:Transcript_19495/g.31921  ORF Transcript_19495/g.31921 Transcript_19495/m.31921 type:complete len:202 (-) Transcript_19495:970-1575(-)